MRYASVGRHEPTQVLLPRLEFLDSGIEVLEFDAYTTIFPS